MQEFPSKEHRHKYTDVCTCSLFSKAPYLPSTSLHLYWC